MLPQGRIAYRAGNARNLCIRMPERGEALAEADPFAVRPDQAEPAEAMGEQRKYLQRLAEKAM